MSNRCLWSYCTVEIYNAVIKIIVLVAKSGPLSGQLQSYISVLRTLKYSVTKLHNKGGECNATHRDRVAKLMESMLG